MSRFTVNKKTSEFTHYSFVGKRRARGSFRRSGALRGLRFSCTPALAAGACNTSDFPSVHITYAISIISCGVSYYCKHRVMKSARLDYYTELDHVDFLEKRLDLHVGLLSVD